MPFDPVVFISSTSEDLQEYREQARNAAIACGFSPRMMEFFPARGDAGSVEACLKLVGEAEVVVVIVAHRYGWVPEGPMNPDHKSITWLECEHAWKVTKQGSNRFSGGREILLAGGAKGRLPADQRKEPATGSVPTTAAGGSAERGEASGVQGGTQPVREGHVHGCGEHTAPGFGRAWTGADGAEAGQPYCRSGHLPPGAGRSEPDDPRDRLYHQTGRAVRFWDRRDLYVTGVNWIGIVTTGWDVRRTRKDQAKVRPKCCAGAPGATFLSLFASRAVSSTVRRSGS
ncbi:MAG: DUF4062 domain-containing protein [Acidimicrobiia bacterium]|nr:DUF4062 domain-containing protein [Acidimicrobiia bacterium]